MLIAVDLFLFFFFVFFLLFSYFLLAKGSNHQDVATTKYIMTVCNERIHPLPRRRLLLDPRFLLHLCGNALAAPLAPL
jgi:hypothetical protein